MSPVKRISPRPEGILSIPSAIERGMSASAWVRERISLDKGYRKTIMLADWRSVAQIEAKKDTLKYVRKNRYPTAKEYAETEWPWQAEYAYKIQTRSRIRPGEPIIERFVIIESDIPLTPLEIVQQTQSRWVERPEEYPEMLEIAIPITAYRRVPSPIE